MKGHPTTHSIIVIGAGVIGLTTALRLLQAGHTVQVVAKDFPPHTTSNLAAAVWYPFLVEPRTRVREWAKATREWCTQLMSEPAAGVRSIDLTVLTQETLWWVEELPPALWSRREEWAGGEPLLHYQVQTLLVETPIFMDYLVEQVASMDGTFLQQEVAALTELPLSGVDGIVNCAGLGAQDLVDDTSLYPVAGHVIPVECEDPLPYVMDEREDDLATVCYIFRRRDMAVVGGSEVAGATNEVDPQIVERIRARARGLAPNLPRGRERTPYVGLRPGRDQVRLERDDRAAAVPVIHNYGHGGGGFTLCWGCAGDVMRLLDA